jgi:hypothetical protein
MVGNVTQAQCANSASTGAGCTVIDPAPESYGPEFAAGGGGVFIAELSVVGVKVWFYPVRLVSLAFSSIASLIQSSDPPFQVKWWLMLPRLTRLY